MTRTKKNKNNNKQKKRIKTMKQKNDIIVLPNNTPANIDEISRNINKEISNYEKEESLVKSYSPTINKELVLLQSVKREEVLNCNNEEAFLLKAPLQIGIPGYI